MFWPFVVYSREAAGEGERHHWECPLPAPPGRWAGTWSMLGWGWVRAPHPAEIAGWWWWWTQNPTATPTLEKEMDKDNVFVSHIWRFGDVWVFTCQQHWTCMVDSEDADLSQLTTLFRRKTAPTATALPSFGCWLTVFFPSCSHVKETILQRFSLHVSLWWHMMPKARNAKWHFSRILFASFFIQGRRHDTWSRREKVKKVHNHLNCQSTCQPRTCFKTARDSEKKKTFFSSQRTKCLMICMDFVRHTKADSVFAKVVLGPALLTFSYSVDVMHILQTIGIC